MKLLTIAVLAIATCTASGGDLKSPDGQYEIEYLKAPPHESNVRLKNAKTGKILGHAFSNGYDHSSYLETAWSHDSRYLAVVERGTRTTADVSVYAFSADSVEEVRLPVSPRATAMANFSARPAVEPSSPDVTDTLHR